MNVNKMKKRILLLLLVIPALSKAQDVMTETRQGLTSPDMELIALPSISVRWERIMHKCIIP